MLEAPPRSFGVSEPERGSGTQELNDMMIGTDWAMGLGGWLWMILAVVLVVAVVWVMVAAVTGRDRPRADGAAEILKARFARGEISQVEYEQARRLLGI